MLGEPRPSNPPTSHAPSSRADVGRERDAALKRLVRVRRGAIATAAALTAGVAAFVSAIAPGRSLGSSTPGRTTAGTTARTAAGGAAASAATGTSSSQMPALEGPAALGLGGSGQPQATSPPQSQTIPAPSSPRPAAAPSDQNGPPVVSGGS